MSTNLMTTTHSRSDAFMVTCLDCGWEESSPEFRNITNKLEDILKDFKRDDYLKTKK